MFLHAVHSVFVLRIQYVAMASFQLATAPYAPEFRLLLEGYRLSNSEPAMGTLFANCESDKLRRNVAARRSDASGCRGVS